MTSESRTQELASSLRSVSLRAADLVGGGAILVFATKPGDDEASLQLRAAAGFDSADAARQAAVVMLPAAKEVLATGEGSRQPSPHELGERAAAESVLIPLAYGAKIHGALVVGCPDEPSDTRLEELSELAETAALRLDHAQLAEQLSRLERKADADSPQSGDDSDEVLKLSEALFAQDIELLRSNEKLGKIEKLKNDFIEKMSRELRTPLNSIIEAIIAVLACEHENISTHAKDMLRIALDEGTSFQRTLENILDLWRIKQCELPIDLQDVNLAEVVDEAIFSVHETLGEKPVEIVKEFENLPRLRTDLAKLNQILFMLLDNAAKFTMDGKIVISARIEGETLECRVSDTGIGVCGDDLEYIFDEFFQVDEFSSTRYRGAGLGLSLVRDLIVLLEGEIQFDSDVGKGTNVLFRLPVQPL